MNKVPIFIHSLFRTGSTYIWHKFRENERYHCYYEPLHPNLLSISPEHPVAWAYDEQSTNRMRHPPLEKPHSLEYQLLLRPGVKGLPFLKKSFIFDEFCKNNGNLALKKYIELLLDNAGDKIPLLQFNRSALRIRWFKKNFPQACHIYLVRNPRNQWHSYLVMQREHNLDIFLVMDMLTIGVNLKENCFQTLAEHIPLIEYHGKRIEDEELIFRQVLETYSDGEKYYLFYYLWFYSLVENVLNADFILNIDLLSSDSDYLCRTYDFLRNSGVEGVDFGDAKITGYHGYILDRRTMEGIEREVQTVILNNLNPHDADTFISELPGKESSSLNLDKEDIIKRQKLKISVGHQDERRIKKYRDIIGVLADQLVFYKGVMNDLEKKIRIKDQLLKQKENQVTQKEEQIKEKDVQIKQKEEQISNLLNSWTYRSGRFLVSPFRLAKKLLTSGSLKKH